MGEHDFLPDAAKDNVTGRQAILREYGVKTIFQEKVRGGVLEMGTSRGMDAKPDIKDLPDAEIRAAFDEFGAVYVLVWICRNDQWTAEAGFTTPERSAYTAAT